MKRDYYNNRTLIWVLIIVGLLIYWVSRDVGFAMFRLANLRETKTYDASEVDSIQVLYTSTDVIMEEHNENNIKVEIYSNSSENMPVIKLEENSLKITDQKGSKFNLIGFNKNQIKLFLPKGKVVNYDITTTSGNVKVTDVQSGSFVVNTTSGNINVDNSKGNTYNAQTSSGNIKLNLITKDCFANTTSGNITVRLDEQSREVVTKTTSGNIKLEVTEASVLDSHSTSGNINGKISAAHLRINTTSGDINMECLKMPEDGISAQSISGNVNIELPKNNGFLLEYSSISGNISNDFTNLRSKKSGTDRYEKGTAIIQVTTTSGDIHIED